MRDLLIVPQGIETLLCHYLLPMAGRLLIVPQGIETIKTEGQRQLNTALNCTTRN